jgi:hypothetical protein
VITIDVLKRPQKTLSPGGRKSFQLKSEKSVGTPKRFVSRLTL